MLTISHKIKDENGIHARPAGLLASEAKKFNCEIFIVKNGKRANAKKIFELMSLCVKGNDEINLEISGDDEKKAFDAIAIFLKNNL